MPAPAPVTLLRVFVPGRLPLGLNARKHWTQTYAARSEIIERVMVYVRNAIRERGRNPILIDPKRPKVVTFETCAPRRRDTDNAIADLKWHRDALVKLGVNPFGLDQERPRFPLLAAAGRARSWRVDHRN